MVQYSTSPNKVPSTAQHRGLKGKVPTAAYGTISNSYVHGESGLQTAFIPEGGRLRSGATATTAGHRRGAEGCAHRSGGG